MAVLHLLLEWALFKKRRKEYLVHRLDYSLVYQARVTADKQDILPTYCTRQAIEQIFGFAKSNNNLLSLRVHSEQSVNGYLMLVFLSLIL
jgi:transposase